MTPGIAADAQSSEAGPLRVWYHLHPPEQSHNIVVAFSRLRFPYGAAGIDLWWGTWSRQSGFIEG
jgi:hypothetical protein